MQKNSENNPNNKETNIKNSARYVAAIILNRYERSDSYVDKMLTYQLRTAGLNPQDKALLTEIVNGVIRWKGKLDWVLTGFYRGDYQKCLNIVKNAMRIALYQIMFLNKIPTHAAIDESVEIVKQVQSEKTAGIVNGVLRNIARNLDNIRYPDSIHDEIYYYSVVMSHPKWLVKKWFDQFGKENTVKMLEFNNFRPFIPIRINTLKTTVAEIEKILNNHNVNYKAYIHFDSSLLLIHPRFDVTETALFQEGKITVQDISASLAVRLADAKPGMRVYDVCAAPGGKSFYLAELMKNSGTLISMDIHESKLSMIKEGAERMGVTIIETMAADAATITLEEQADIVFADVPCSGLGVLQKKPDIRWDKELDDVRLLAKKQKLIIDNVSKMVKPGGVLLYSTCTLMPEENEDIIEAFLAEHDDFELDTAENYLHEDLCRNGYMQTLPFKNFIDGAFAARLIKKSPKNHES